MKILVKAEKAGQVVAEAELELGDDRDPMRRVGKAFKLFREKHPNVSLLEEDVCLRFSKSKEPMRLID